MIIIKITIIAICAIIIMFTIITNVNQVRVVMGPNCQSKLHLELLGKGHATMKMFTSIIIIIIIITYMTSDDYLYPPPPHHHHHNRVVWE